MATCVMWGPWGGLSLAWPNAPPLMDSTWPCPRVYLPESQSVDLPHFHLQHHTTIFLMMGSGFSVCQHGVGPYSPSHASGSLERILYYQNTFRGSLEKDDARLIEVDAEQPGPFRHGISGHGGLDEMSAIRQASPVSRAQDNQSCNSCEQSFHR